MIDPKKWLESHDPGAGSLDTLALGRAVLAEHAGNGWIALHAQPEVAIEIMLAWLLREVQTGDAAALIPQLAAFVDAADEARYS